MSRSSDSQNGRVLSDLSVSTSPDTGVALPILELRKLGKKFSGTHALKEIDLAFISGEIHAIVGENGAGKSTLIKILTGALERTSGEIFSNGVPLSLGSPAQSLELGIDAVHQEVVLCGHLSVAANLFLGTERTRFGLLKQSDMVRKAQQVLDNFGFDLPSVTVPLNTLTIGQQQLVATARAAARGARFLIFDEPTGYLTRSETDQLFALIRRLNAAGTTIVYISHRMEEIFELADRVSVLRDGRIVSTRLVSETNIDELIRDMVARSIEEVHHKEEVQLGDVLLEVEGLSGPGFENVSLKVRRGEIVGLYGLIGAGRSEFAQTLFGRTARSAGVIRINGKELIANNVNDAIKAGIALLPESRRDQGLCLNLDVRFNLALPSLRRLSTGGFVNARKEDALAQRQIENLGIVTSSATEKVFNLSGGNQQKIVIGKWLHHGAELFIFDEPTVGVDVGTKVQIYKLFAELLRHGAGIIIISSYLPEVYDLADTLHVFRKGGISATFPAKAVHHETVLGKAIGN